MRRLLQWLSGGPVAAHGRPTFRPEVTDLEARDVPSSLGHHAARHAAHFQSRYFSDLLAVRSIPAESTYTVPGWDVRGGVSVNPNTTYTVPGWDLQGGVPVDPYTTYTTPGYDVQGSYSFDPHITYIDSGSDFFGPGYDSFDSGYDPYAY